MRVSFGTIRPYNANRLRLALFFIERRLGLSGRTGAHSPIRLLRMLISPSTNAAGTRYCYQALLPGAANFHANPYRPASLFGIVEDDGVVIVAGGKF